MTEIKKWYQLGGADSDVVISTRVRFARNLRTLPFPNAMTDEQRAKMNKEIREAAINGGGAIGSRFIYKELSGLEQRELVSLVERHLISPEFARKPQGRAILLLDDESVSIMLGEEDHLRLQVLFQGMGLAEAFDTADKLDALLSERLDFAFDSRLGYLTACPTNLGTAMRASVMVHIPALEATGSLRRLSESIAKLGLTIRGMYGEGSGSSGALYQISNQETLGVTEKGTIEKLTGIVSQITKLERDAREKICADPTVQDKIWRSCGILRSARMLSGEEFINMYSPVRMGAAAGIIPGVSLDSLNELFICVQPGTIMMSEGRNMTPQERDSRRAELVRAALS